MTTFTQSCICKNKCSIIQKQIQCTQSHSLECLTEGFSSVVSSRTIVNCLLVFYFWRNCFPPSSFEASCDRETFPTSATFLILLLLNVVFSNPPTVADLSLPPHPMLSYPSCCTLHSLDPCTAVDVTMRTSRDMLNGKIKELHIKVLLRNLKEDNPVPVNYKKRQFLTICGRTLA